MSIIGFFDGAVEPIYRGMMSRTVDIDQQGWSTRYLRQSPNACDKKEKEIFRSDLRVLSTCRVCLVRPISSPIFSSPLLSSPVLSSLIRNYLALSSSILSCPILSCPVLSSPFLSSLILSYPNLSSLILNYPNLSSLILSSPILRYPNLSSPFPNSHSSHS